MDVRLFCASHFAHNQQTVSPIWHQRTALRRWSVQRCRTPQCVLGLGNWPDELPVAHDVEHPEDLRLQLLMHLRLVRELHQQHHKLRKQHVWVTTASPQTTQSSPASALKKLHFNITAITGTGSGIPKFPATATSAKSTVVQTRWKFYMVIRVGCVLSLSLSLCVCVCVCVGGGVHHTRVKDQQVVTLLQTAGHVSKFGGNACRAPCEATNLSTGDLCADGEQFVFYLFREDMRRLFSNNLTFLNTFSTQRKCHSWEFSWVTPEVLLLQPKDFHFLVGDLSGILALAASLVASCTHRRRVDLLDARLGDSHHAVQHLSSQVRLLVLD